MAVSEQGEALPQAQATAIMAGIQPLPEGAAEKARTQIESQLPAGYKPVYLNQLQLLYDARDMQPMWEKRDAVKAFQQQLAEVAISGFQPQFNKWVELLTDPGAVSYTHLDVYKRQCSIWASSRVVCAQRLTVVNSIV